MQRKLAIGIAALFTSHAGWAGAEPPQPERSSNRVSSQDTADGYAYEFEDDPLDAQGATAQGLRLRVRAAGQRSYLIRPRIQFVRELLRSAENL